MARVDVVDLKSFQKISLSEVRYLSEIDTSKNQLLDRRYALTQKTPEDKIDALKIRTKSALATVRNGLKSALYNLLYETVPVRDTYLPE